MTTVLAACTGWRSSAGAELELSPVQRFAVDLTGVAGRTPRVVYINTAGGDQQSVEVAEREAAERAGLHARHLRLFDRGPEPLDELVADADLVWVGGGSVVNLLAVWRAHSLDAVLLAAAERGTVLAGTSAGALCWHVGGPTSSRGPALDVIDDGIGLVAGSLGVHYDSQEARRPLLHDAVASGRLPAGIGLEEGTAVLYRDGRVVDALSEGDGGVFRVEPGGVGRQAVEHRLDTRSI